MSGAVLGWVAGVLTWPVAFVAVVAVGKLRQGSWTSLDNLCSCPKDGRTEHPFRVRTLPASGLWPLRRCPICGSRWARSYLRRVPGASRLLVAMWSAPPVYTDAEFDARWDAYEARVSAAEQAARETHPHTDTEAGR